MRTLRLSFDSSGECFSRAGRDGRVAVDQLRDDAAHDLDSERQRRDVEQQRVLHIAGEDRGLNGCSESDDFVGVELGMGLGSEQVADGLADKRDARGATDEHDFRDVFDCDACIADAFAAGSEGALDNGSDELVEQRPRDLALIAPAAVLAGR